MADPKSQDDAALAKAAIEGPTRPKAQDVVVKQLGPIRSRDIDKMLRVRHSNERLKRLKALINSWSGQQKEERKLRRSFARTLLWLFGAEVFGIFVAFFTLGMGWLHIPEWAAGAFLVSALGQSTTLVLVVVKYLFPERNSDILKLVDSLIANPNDRDQEGS